MQLKKTDVRNFREDEGRSEGEVEERWRVLGASEEQWKGGAEEQGKGGAEEQGKCGAL